MESRQSRFNVRERSRKDMRKGRAESKQSGVPNGFAAVERT